MPARFLPFGSNTLIVPAYLVTDWNEPAFLQWRRDHPQAFIAGTWSSGPSRRKRTARAPTPDLRPPQSWESDPVASAQMASLDPSTLSVQDFMAIAAASRADSTTLAPSGGAQPSADANDIDPGRAVIQKAAVRSAGEPAPQDTPEVRNALANHLIRPGNLATEADVAVVHDYMVAHVPAETMRLMAASRLHIQVTREAITSELPGFAGRRPRGYDSGDWSRVVGTYDPSHHAVVIATRDGPAGDRRMPDARDSGSVDALIHEIGHGINYTQSVWHNVSNTDEFVDAYRQDTGTGPLAVPYYHQNNNGRDGRDEAFAESFAMYNHDPSAMRREYPHLFAFFQKFMTEHRGD